MNKRLTGFICCVLALVSLVSFTGCGSKNANDLLISGASRLESKNIKQTDDTEPSAANDLLDILTQKYAGSIKAPTGKKLDKDGLKRIKDKLKTPTPPTPTPTTAPTQPGGSSTNPTSPSDTAPTSPKDGVVDSREKLLAAFHEAYRNTNDCFKVTIDNSKGFTFDKNEWLEIVQSIKNEIERDYPVDTWEIDGWRCGQQGNEYYFEINYYSPVKQLRAMKAKAVTLAKEAVKDSGIKAKKGKSQREIVSEVNEYLCDKVTYGGPNETEPYDAFSHTSNSAFERGKAVCDGYSCATKLMLDQLGVKSTVVVGECKNSGGGGGHAWNQVKVDGKWYNLDVTWNDGTESRKEFFLVNDDFMSQSRTWDTSMYQKVP